MARIIEAFKQFFDDSGDPLVNGWLKFTESGTNNTDKDTYADVSETIQNSNPVQLDAAGRCPNVFGSGAYRVTSYVNDTALSQPGTQIQQFDPVGLQTGTGPFEDWNADSIYSQGQIVTGSGGNYYRSIINNNQGDDPSLSTANWEQIEFVAYWNISVSYSIYDRVRTSDGTMFVSLESNNLGNAPDTSSTKWRAEDIRTWSNTDEYRQYEIVRDSVGALWRSLIAANLGNDPQTDDGTKWLSVETPRVLPFSGSGTLVAYATNELQDSSTYTLPAASSVKAGGWVEVELPDRYSEYEPTVQRAGSDTITDVDGTDTAVLFDTAASVTVRFISDGVSDWRI